MAEAVEIIKTRMNSEQLSNSSHMLANVHYINDFIGNLSDPQSKQSAKTDLLANINRSKLIQSQKDQSDKRNDEFNNVFVLLNYDNHTVTNLFSKEQATQYLNGLDEAANDPSMDKASATAGVVAGGTALSSAYANANPLGSAIQGNPTKQPAVPDALTADKSANGGDSVYHSVWRKAIIDGVSAYDPSLFEAPLTKEQLINNESFQSAAEVMYNFNRDKGDPTWAQHKENMGWSDKRAAQELGDWGRDHAMDMAHDTETAVAEAWNASEDPPHVQTARLFMIHAYDHEEISTEVTLEALGTMATDRVNVALFILGIASSFVTFGAGGAAAAAAIAARQAAMTGARRIAINAMTSNVMKNVLGTTAKATITRGMAVGGAESLADDYFLRHGMEKDGFKTLGQSESVEYSATRALTTTIVGTATGGAFTGGGVWIGKKFRAPHEAKIVSEYEAKLAKEAADKATKDAEAKAAKEASEKLAKDAAEKEAKETAAKAAQKQPNPADVDTPPTSTDAPTSDSNVVNIFKNAAKGDGKAPSSAQTTDFDVTGNSSTLDKILQAGRDGIEVELGADGSIKTRLAGRAATKNADPAPSDAGAQQPRNNTSDAEVSSAKNTNMETSTSNNTDEVASRTDKNSETDTPANESSTESAEDSTSSSNLDKTNDDSPVSDTTSSNTTSKGDGESKGTIKHENIVPAPDRTILHTAFSRWRNPYFFIRTLIGGQDPSEHLPSHLAYGKYIDPVIEAIDTKIDDAKLFSKLGSLRQEIQTTTESLSLGEINMDTAKANISKTLEAFSETHSGDLEKFSKSLDPIITEIKFERNIAEIVEQSQRGDILKEVALKRANSVMEDYTSSTGKKIDTVKILESVEKGGKGLFRLEYLQANAMLKYLGQLKGISNDYTDPTKILNDIDTIISTQGKTNGTQADIAGVIQHSFDATYDITNKSMMRETDKGLNNWKDTIPDLPGLSTPMTAIRGQRNRQYNLEDTDNLSRQFELGYYNNAVRTKPIVPGKEANNAERYAMMIEAIKGSDKPEALAELMRKCYDEGLEVEGLNALLHLHRRTGQGDNAIPAGFLDTIIPGPKKPADGGRHYDNYLKTIESIARADHSPVDMGQRAVLKMVSESTKNTRYARRFAGRNHIATVFRDDHFNVPLTDEIYQFTHRLVGRSNFKFEYDDNRARVRSSSFFKPLKEGETERGWRSTIYEGVKVPFRAGFNIATAPVYIGYRTTKGLLTNSFVNNPITRGAAITYGAASGVLIAGEEGYELITGTDSDADIGLRMLDIPINGLNYAMAPIRWGVDLNNKGLNAVTGINFLEYDIAGFQPLGFAADQLDLNNNLIPLSATYIGDRGNLSKAEALDIINADPRYAGYEQAVKDAAAARMDAEEDIDPEKYMTEESIAYTAKMKEDPPEPQSTTEQSGGGQKPGKGSPQQARDEGDSSTGSTFNDVANKGSDVWDSVTGGLSGVLEGAFPNSGISTALSSAFNWAGSTFSQMKNGQIKHGQDFLAYGGAAVAALVIAPWIGAKLGILNLGGIGSLLIGFLIIGYGSQMVKGMMTGGSSNIKLPKMVTDLVSGSDDEEEQEEEQQVDKSWDPKAINDENDGDQGLIGDKNGDGLLEVYKRKASNIAGQSNGIVNVTAMRQIVGGGAAANEAEFKTALNRTQNNGNFISADQLGLFAGAANFEGDTANVINMDGSKYTAYSETGKLNDPELIVLQHAG